MCSARALSWCFTVDDDGRHSEDQRQRMFERGVQLDERRTGSGLGLDIVRALADSYGRQRAGTCIAVGRRTPGAAASGGGLTGLRLMLPDICQKPMGNLSLRLFSLSLGEGRRGDQLLFYSFCACCISVAAAFNSNIAAGSAVWLPLLGNHFSGMPGHHAAAARAALGAHVYEPVGRLDHVQVVLDDDDGVAGVAQLQQHPAAGLCRQSAGRSGSSRM